MDSGSMQSGAGGLYVRIDPDLVLQAPGFRHALTDPSIDGAAIMVRWSSIEQRPGVYDWHILDPWLSQVISLRKKLSLGVMAGWFTPEWLYDSAHGVPANRFRYNRHPQGQPLCAILTLPSPWNAVFVREYNAMTRDLARHLRTFEGGGAYANLRMIKVGGINNTTEELRLVANGGDNGPCKQSDAQAIWKAAGFRPSNIVEAWRRMAQTAADVFPQALLSNDVIQAGAFPPIDERGNIYRPQPRTTDALTDRIINIGIRRWGSRFSVQWDGLSQAPVDPAVVRAGQRGATIGWQLNHVLLKGSGCIYGLLRKPCGSVDEYQTMFENGIRNGGKFIEVWADDLDQYRTAYEFAHRQLLRR
jgi:hypothetical protein